MDIIKKTRKHSQLETHAQVVMCLQKTIRELKKMVVADPSLDPIRINKAKTMVIALKTLAELISTAGITQIPDDALISEVIRRRDARVGHTSLSASAEQ
jgi:hypothetical protein